MKNQRKEPKVLETSLKSGVVIQYTEDHEGRYQKSYVAPNGEDISEEECALMWGFEPHPDDVEAHRKRVKAGESHEAAKLKELFPNRKAQWEKEKQEKEKAEKADKAKAEKPKAAKQEKPDAEKPSTLPDSGPKP